MEYTTENDLTGGATGQPASPTSAGSPPTSLDVTAFVAAARANPEFASLVKDLAGREFQSVKDRRIGKLENTQANFAAQLAEYQKLREDNLGHNAALKMMELGLSAQGLGEQAGPVEQQAAGGSRQAAAPNVDMDKALELLGLRNDDPEVTNLVRQGGELGELFSLALKKRQATVAPNAAAVLPTGSFSPQPGDTLETRAAELERLGKLGNARTGVQDRDYRKLLAQLAQDVRG